ncbi:MAG: fructose-bisphosphate aldolase [candidate division Zixibacteria bacterium]|nr:fructose-bisphosphate aldolase [candidate division Zixibacteria bacterium]
MTKAKPVSVGPAPRPSLWDLDISAGKKARLYRMLYQFGPRNGTFVFLPLDQGLEHGPVDFFQNPDSLDTDYIFRLGIAGEYSGVALHVGLAEKYYPKYAGRIPLVLKLNGRTSIPSEAQALSPLTGSVDDAVRLAADAVGYTLYVGSPSQEHDIATLNEVRFDCERLGMPLIVWAYPRGEAIEKKGGRDSLYAVDYAARVAEELGADIVKINLPKGTSTDSPKPYPSLPTDEWEMARKVVRSAGRCMVLFSGGSKLGDADLIAKVEVCMKAGATGLIFGRNMWQRTWDDALSIGRRVHEVLGHYGIKDRT